MLPSQTELHAWQISASLCSILSTVSARPSALAGPICRNFGPSEAQVVVSSPELIRHSPPKLLALDAPSLTAHAGLQRSTESQPEPASRAPAAHGQADGGVRQWKHHQGQVRASSLLLLVPRQRRNAPPLTTAMDLSAASGAVSLTAQARSSKPCALVTSQQLLFWIAGTSTGSHSAEAGRRCSSRGPWRTTHASSAAQPSGWQTAWSLPHAQARLWTCGGLWATPACRSSWRRPLGQSQPPRPAEHRQSSCAKPAPAACSQTGQAAHRVDLKLQAPESQLTDRGGAVNACKGARGCKHILRSSAWLTRRDCLLSSPTRAFSAGWT